MRHLRPLSARLLFAAALASTACTDGKLEALRSADAGVDTAAHFGASGAGGNASGRGDPASPFAGAGGGGMFMPCASDPASEDPLVNALNHAISDGRFCLRRPLMVREDLRCDAYRLATALSLDAPDSPWVEPALGWHAIPDGSGRAWWASREAANVDEARDAMLSEDSTEICENAGHTPYRWVAVAHVFDSWVIELRPDMP
jgi:hypothetical protein